MGQKSRVELRDELLTSLGMLVAPIRSFLFEDLDSRKVPLLRSRFERDFAAYSQLLHVYSQIDGMLLSHEYSAACRMIRDFSRLIQIPSNPESREALKSGFEAYLSHARRAIHDIPCDDPGTILASETPYSTYIRLRAICQGAVERLDLFDPYLDAETFHRYLPQIPEGVRVIVVTSSEIMSLPATTSPTSRKALRRDRIVAVSQLLASQYSDRYQFRISDQLHDHHIRVDDQIVHLGGSTKDAALSDYFTISNVDSVQSTHVSLDEIIARATEWFGPSVPSHRGS
jgi:hypothetical protein